jgi:hypothetical protein
LSSIYKKETKRKKMGNEQSQGKPMEEKKEEIIDASQIVRRKQPTEEEMRQIMRMMGDEQKEPEEDEREEPEENEKYAINYGLFVGSYISKKILNELCDIETLTEGRNVITEEDTKLIIDIDDGDVKNLRIFIDSIELNKTQRTNLFSKFIDNTIKQEMIEKEADYRKRFKFSLISHVSDILGVSRKLFM